MVGFAPMIIQPRHPGVTHNFMTAYHSDSQMDIETSTNRELSIAHLSRDPFDSLLTLKMLSMFPNDCATTLYRDDSGWACRTELAVKVSAWDRNEYPTVDRIVMIDGNSPSILRHILRYPANDSVVYKVHDQSCRSELGEDPQFHHANAFHSYTTAMGREMSAVQSAVSVVEKHSRYDDEAAALFAASGYTAEEFRLHMDRGARWFAVRKNNRIVAFCLAFRIFEKIWEIGGVLTLREHRRNGFARAVVSAALGYFNERNLIPRYQFHYRNGASRCLAGSLGLKLRLVIDHYVNHGS